MLLSCCPSVAPMLVMLTVVAVLQVNNTGKDDSTERYAAPNSMHQPVWCCMAMWWLFASQPTCTQTCKAMNVFPACFHAALPSKHCSADALTAGLPSFVGLWSVAKAVQSAVQQTTNEVVRSVQQTDWKSELAAFTQEVEAEAQKVSHKAVEVVQHLPAQLHTRTSEVRCAGCSPHPITLMHALAAAPLSAYVFAKFVYEAVLVYAISPRQSVWVSWYAHARATPPCVALSPAALGMAVFPLCCLLQALSTAWLVCAPCRLQQSETHQPCVGFRVQEAALGEHQSYIQHCRREGNGALFNAAPLCITPHTTA